MFGGFWGTEREEAWHRRKEREYQRESEIRNEEQRRIDAIVAVHERQLNEKDAIQDLTRRMLSSARYDAADNKRRRLEGKTDDGDAERAEESSVRENLLALSYAMFDTLFGAKSFQPSHFGNFLKKIGETSLAEQIAIAAVDKSRGSKETVEYVLNEMVPASDEPEVLVKEVTEILEQKRFGGENGKRALYRWQGKQGNAREAFEAALLIADELERLKCALPYATNSERRATLKEKCPKSLSDSVIGIFEEEEWPDFMAYVLSMPHDKMPDFGFWAPKDEVYLQFATTQLRRPRNEELARNHIRKCIQGKFVPNVRNDTAPSGSQPIKQSLLSKATRMYDETLDLITKFNDSFANETMQSFLDQLNIDPFLILAEEFGRALQNLPPVPECTTRHKSDAIAFRCTKCRSTAWKVACDLGIVRAVHTHPLTAHCAPFLSLGFKCKPNAILALLTDAGRVHPEIARALLGSQDCSIYCARAQVKQENDSDSQKKLRVNEEDCEFSGHEKVKIKEEND